jgi:hypothetical protein
MWRWLIRWLAPLLILATWALPALAQQQPPADESGNDIGVSTAALPALVAVLSTLLVLVITCKPSRKS